MRVQRRSQARALTKDRIERCWAWLEHWGHAVERVALDDMDTIEMLDLADREARRVRALAETWEAWW